MQSNRPLVLGFVATALAAAGIWFVARGDEAPAPSTAPVVAEQPVAPAPAAGPVGGGSGLEATDPAKDLERIAVAAGSGVDERRPGFTGIVVGPDGRPLAGALVSVAPGLGFANANGAFDPQSFDASAFEDIAGGGFDPAAILRTVREQLKDRVEVATDRDGRFRVVAKGATRAVGLRVLARGHAIFDRRFDRPKDRDVDVGTLTLQAAAIVAGRVVTPDGAPVAGARVGRMLEVEQRLLGGMEFDVPEMGEVEALRGDAAITDELGRFELAHVAPGALTLRARHPEHPTATSMPLALEAGRELRSVLLTMQVGGVITGVVQGLPADSKGLQVMAGKKPKADAADPTGIAGVAGMFGNLAGNLDDVMNEAGIGIGERSASIAADGKFELRGLARETYRVWVARTGTGLAGSTVCSARVEAAPGSSVELQFEAGVTVTFTVANAKTDAPVDLLIVRDRLRGGGGVADLMGGVAAMGGLQARRPAHYPNGAVTVANLRPKPNQKLTLTIEALGFAALERGDLELPKVGNLDLGVLKLEPVPVLTVTVASAADGRPVEGASVRLAGSGPGSGNRNGTGNNPGAGPGRRAIPREFRRFVPGGNGGGFDSGRTDRAGRITLNRPLQAATIEVDAKDFAPFESASIAFSAAGPEAFAAQLHLGGAVAVTVCELGDKPVAGALVEHRSPDGDVDEKKADDQGIARFEHLAPGAHQFRLGKEGGGLGRMMSRFGGRAGGNGNGASTPAADEAPWQSLDVADKSALALRLVKLPTAMLRGVVRENGVPLPGARVAFREGPPASGGDPMANGLGALAERFGDRTGGAAGGNNRSPRTDEQGLYQLRDLPAGQHHLSITHKSRAMPVTMTIVLRDGENVVDVDLDMTTLRGVVKDGQGQPVDGATIRVQRPRAGGDPAGDIGGALESLAPGLNLGGGSTIKTDASGAYEVRGIDPDVELELSASAKGFAPAAAKVTAARGTTTAAPDLVLAAAGKVRVTVAGNQPFATVRARWAGSGEGTAPVLGMVRGGKGTLDGLRPGPWEISVESAEALGARLGGRFGRRQGQQDGQPQQPAAPQQKRMVEVVAGQTVDVEL